MIRLHILLTISVLAGAPSLGATVVYTNAGPITADETGPGTNLPGLTLSRSSTATGPLYFKYTVTNPASNWNTEPLITSPYFAGMQLFDGAVEKLGVGNGAGNWSYSAFNAEGGASLDLNSATPEPGKVHQRVRLTDVTTIVFRIDYNDGANDAVTVWLNPDLSLTEAAQSPTLRTTFSADATFTEVRLREGGPGGGWSFSDMAIATYGADPGFFAPVPEPATAALIGVVGVVGAAFATRRRPR